MEGVCGFSQVPALLILRAVYTFSMRGQLGNTCLIRFGLFSEESTEVYGQVGITSSLGKQTVQNKLELWIYSAYKTSAGINNGESKGLSAVHTSGTHTCFSPAPPPFLMKMIPVALIDNNNTKQLKAMGGWREEKGFS